MGGCVPGVIAGTPGRGWKRDPRPAMVMSRDPALRTRSRQSQQTAKRGWLSWESSNASGLMVRWQTNVASWRGLSVNPRDTDLAGTIQNSEGVHQPHDNADHHDDGKNLFDLSIHRKVGVDEPSALPARRSHGQAPAMPDREKLKDFTTWCRQHIAGDEKRQTQIFGTTTRSAPPWRWRILFLVTDGPQMRMDEFQEPRTAGHKSTDFPAGNAEPPLRAKPSILVRARTNHLHPALGNARVRGGRSCEPRRERFLRLLPRSPRGFPKTE